MLSLQGITKTFPGVRALHDVGFSVEAGSIHALCGENGAGKSTLLKILSGVHRPDSGTVTIQGRPAEFRSAREAIDAGVAVIYQELNLIPELSIAENIWLGHLPQSKGVVKRAELRRRTAESLAKVGLTVDPWTKVGRLPIAQRQMVEIAKALSHQAEVIAFDEPTSSLSSREVDVLFGLIRELRSQGKAILYVSHRMDEVTSLCDACTVLRDGQTVETFPTMEGVTGQAIIRRMVGRDIDDVFGYRPRTLGDVRLECRYITGHGLTEPCSLSVRSGEILGIFGLVGAGRTELLKAIYEGKGHVAVDGTPVPRSGPRASIRAGIVLCPEDRKHEGIVPMMSVAENANLSVRRRTSRFGVLNVAAERENASHYIQALQVKTPSPQQQIRHLSGGNQQKVILARWLSEDINVLLLDEPTRGIDVGAKAEIHEIVRQTAEKGVAVVMVSSELPEVIGTCDRILAMEGGRITGELSRDEATEEKLLSLALPGQNEVPA